MTEIARENLVILLVGVLWEIKDGYDSKNPRQDGFMIMHKDPYF